MRELDIETPKALADFCEVSEGLVSQWFSGQTKLGPKPLRAFARTRFSLDWITDGVLPKYRAEKNVEQESRPPGAPRAVLPDPGGLVRPADIAELIILFGQSDAAGRALILDLARSAGALTQQPPRRRHGD